jgi:hypothetical protein
MIIEDFAPKTNLEWLWILDLTAIVVKDPALSAPQRENSADLSYQRDRIHFAKTGRCGVCRREAE